MQKGVRVVVHVDLDAFSAQCEMLSTQVFLIGQIERDVINRNKFRREIPSIEVPGFMNIEAFSQHVARWKDGDIQNSLPWKKREENPLT